MSGSKLARPLLWGMLLTSACIRFQPAALDPPAAFLERCILCPRVETRAGTAEPAGEKLLYQGGDSFSIFSFVELGDLRGGHLLQWKWYAPSGILMRRSDEIPVGEPGRTFARYLAWDELRLESGSERGAWTSSIFLDADLLATREFVVR